MVRFFSFLAGVAAGSGRGGGAVAGGAAGVLVSVGLFRGIWFLVSRYWFIIIPLYLVYYFTDDSGPPPRSSSPPEYQNILVSSGVPVLWSDVPESVVPRDGLRPNYDVLALITMRNQNAVSINNYQVACMVPDRNHPYDTWQIGQLTRDPATPRSAARYATSIPAERVYAGYFGFKTRMINGTYGAIRDCRIVSYYAGGSLPPDLAYENRQIARRAR